MSSSRSARELDALLSGMANILGTIPTSDAVKSSFLTILLTTMVRKMVRIWVGDTKDPLRRAADTDPEDNLIGRSLHKPRPAPVRPVPAHRQSGRFRGDGPECVQGSPGVLRVPHAAARRGLRLHRLPQPDPCHFPKAAARRHQGLPGGRRARGLAELARAQGLLLPRQHADPASTTTGSSSCQSAAFCPAWSWRI